MKTFIILLFCSTFSLLASIGSITEIKGNAFIKQASTKKYKKLKGSVEINKGDIIKTSRNAYVAIEFNDKSNLTVFQRSTIKIDKNITDKNDSKSITLFSGKLWAKVHKRITKKNFFKINTPTATAGVRGTSFGVMVAPNGSSLVRVNKGRVVFDSDLDPMVVKQNKKIDEPKEVEATQKAITGPPELRIKTSKINSVNNSISTDMLTGFQKKSLVLNANNSASFRLDQGVKPEAKISTSQFETEEEMPETTDAKKEVIKWHISNMNHRMKKANSLVIRVQKISAGIESMKTDKRFNLQKISASTKKGKRDIEHISEEIENLGNSLDAQAHFLEGFAQDDPEIQELMKEHNKFNELKNNSIK